MKRPIGLIMATELEAAPVIARSDFEQMGNTPFPVYQGKHIVLLICGMGKVHAANGTRWMIQHMHPRFIVNAGAAGRTGSVGVLGELFQIETVSDGDRWASQKSESVYNLIPTGSLPHARLATYEEPVKSATARFSASVAADMVDMEGVAVVQVCQQSDTAVHLIKYVSDGQEGDDIIDAILRLRKNACEQILDCISDLM